MHYSRRPNWLPGGQSKDPLWVIRGNVLSSRGLAGRQERDNRFHVMLGPDENGVSPDGYNGRIQSTQGDWMAVDAQSMEEVQAFLTEVEGMEEQRRRADRPDGPIGGEDLVWRLEDGMELKDVLADWLDDDVAAYRLGVFLGVFPRDQTFSSVKRMFWIDGYPLGDMLLDILDRMAQAGVLLKNEDDVQYKWNPAPTDLS